MSLTAQERQDVVTYRIEKAQKTLLEPTEQLIATVTGLARQALAT